MPTMTGAAGLVARLVKGAVAGVVAGLVFIAMNMWYAASTGGPAAMPLHVISTLVLGDAAMPKGTTNPVLGAVVHVVLSAAFGAGVALVTARLRSNAAVMVASTVAGGLLFVLNFLILAPLFFHVFENPNKPFELAIHVVFGTLVGFALLTHEGTARGDGPARAAQQRGV